MRSRVTFIVPGDVVPWARAGGGKTMRKFTPQKQRNYMAVIRDYANRAIKAGGGIFDGPVKLKVVAVYVWPKTTTKKRREASDGAWKFTKPDADNLTKIVKDSLNGIAFGDDAQVSCLMCWKVLGESAGLVVEISSLEGVEAPSVEL